MLEKLGVKSGMAVFDAAGQSLGAIETVNDNDFTVGSKGYTVNDVSMVEPSGVYLSVK
ncbi:hypothetical protein [Croceicoccus gelatinilyticus]|uniref:hypothetical protein n=1 Tax=Croceicoccus gelatinilyticus TaxID=2835536 RepID=UPI001BCE67C4|nr:hypothetical protein [Croceicoccus gelatinilyticus]MBS7670816.1 hypothetical protein [Croceicoccus gelatinilyticus]